MPKPRTIGGIVTTGVGILGTFVSSTTNRILAQVGSVVKESVESSGAEWIQHVGFVSRPSAPVAGKTSAQGVVLKTPGRDVVVGSSDARGLELQGNLGSGETALYAAGEDGEGQARIVLKGSGAIALYTTSDNTADGMAVFLRIGPDGLSFVAPWGSLTFDRTGFHLKTEAGPRIDMGGINIPGVPSAVVDAFAGYCTITSPIFKADASGVYLGHADVYQPIVIAPINEPLGVVPPNAVPMGQSFQCGTVWAPQ